MGAEAYKDAVEIVRSGDSGQRALLAANPSTPPEFLYFLAEDPDAAVRRAVAENPATPEKANLLLAKDKDMAVRCMLARKLVGEGLAEAEREKLWRMGFTILETLMRDKYVQVRKILSEAFCTAPGAPHGIVFGLARDVAVEVAAPILTDSPVLTEDDLVAIVEEGAPGWAQEAISERAELPSRVADAVIKGGNPRAGAAVLGRKDTELSEEALERALTGAEEVSEWQAPLVVRPDVKGGMLVRLAKFVAAPLLSMLRARPDVRDDVASEMDTAIAERPAEGSADELPEEEFDETEEEAAARAQRLYKAGDLTDTSISANLETRHTDFVLHAVALRAGLPVEKVKQMVLLQSGRTVMALSWKVGFSARFGMELQRTLARISPRKLMNARDGLDYPMSEEEMRAELSLFA